LIPERYNVSKLRARVVAPNGHASKELDLVFLDRKESVALMCRNEVVEYYPRECVYGAIQIKSCMRKADILSAFENLATFKSLYDSAPPFAGSLRGRKPSNRGFTLVFAFDSALDSNDLVATAEFCAKSHPPDHWPNAIVVLSKGIFLFGTVESQSYHNADITQLSEPTLWTIADNWGRCLYDFYLMIIDLLRSTVTSPPNISDYFRLPLVMGKLSFSFAHGPYDETGHCEKHGSFLRMISDENLAKILSFCMEADAINWLKALDIASGKPGDNHRAYERQPLEVKIYNPKTIPLDKLLLSPEGNLQIEYIVVEDVHIWIPYYYSDGEALIDSCPKCQRSIRKNRRLA
jgi:hypothetical protein